MLSLTLQRLWYLVGAGWLALSGIYLAQGRAPLGASFLALGVVWIVLTWRRPAAMLFCVFASFVVGDARVLKVFGLRLAVAVLVDATVVRLVLVPRPWSYWATPTGGSPGGSSGSCPTSTSTGTRWSRRPKQLRPKSPSAPVEAASPAARPAPARRTPPSRNRRRARGPGARCVRQRAGVHVSAIRRTAGAPAPGRRGARVGRPARR